MATLLVRAVDGILGTHSRYGRKFSGLLYATAINIRIFHKSALGLI